MNSSILLRVRKDLKEAIDDKAKVSFQRFFKEKVTYYGVKTADVKKIGQKYFPEVRKLPKAKIFALAEEMFSTHYCEEAWIATRWIDGIHSQFTEAEFQVFERWIANYIDNWATCDTFCGRVMGTFIEMYPHYLRNLKAWSKSKNRWVKRASAVSLILPARNGKYLSDIFEIADILLTDSDDMVQKGYGWLLKEASRKHQKEVFDYIVKHKNVMPRTALRYGIEKMPVALKKKAMER